MADDREDRLNKLFDSYRSACKEIEPSANFGPVLWQRIEARRSPVSLWALMSRRALVGAMALCLLLGTVMRSALSSSQFYQTTYIEELDASELPEDLAAMQPVSLEIGGASAGQQ